MMHPKCLIKQENDSSIPFPFHQLVPDCRKLILSFHFHQIRYQDLREPTTPENAESDLTFALENFKCEATLNSSVGQDASHLLTNLYSLRSYRAIPRNIFLHFRKLVELYISDNGTLIDDMFQHLESLEVLDITAVMGVQFLSDKMFVHLKHLRNLSISGRTAFTDRAFENLHNAGSRLQRLRVRGCRQITDHALSFLDGEFLKKLNIASCPRFLEEGLKHLRGLEHLSLESMDHINCREAFKFLHQCPVQFLRISCSNLPSLDEVAMSHLRNISTLVLDRSAFENLTNSAFLPSSGKIKRLELRICVGLERLDKNMLWYLHGIQHVELLLTGIKIESMDLPRLEEVLKNVSCCKVSSDFADGSTLKQMQQFVEGNLGCFCIECFE